MRHIYSNLGTTSNDSLRNVLNCASGVGKFAIVILFFLSYRNVANGQCTSSVYYDNMETFTWAGDWYLYNYSNFYTNISVSPTASAAHYGLGNGSSGIEQDWYVLPNITGLNPAYTYKVKFRLASTVLTGTTAATRGVDVGDFIEVQLSTNGGVSYSSEIRILGNSNAIWNYSATGVAAKTANGTLTQFTTPAGSQYALRPDGYSTVELTLPVGSTQCAVDIYNRVNSAGEDFWIDNVELIEIIPQPTLAIAGNTPICSGGSLTLTASGAQTYSWNNGISNGVPFNPTSSSTYTVIGTNTGMVNGIGSTNSCTATANVSVTVNPNPIANSGGALSAICQSGTSAPMGGSVSGGATGGTWSGGTGTWTNANNPSTATYTAGASETGTITLTLTTSGGSCGTATTTKTITVNPNPTANAGGALSAICQGSTSPAMGGSVGGGATGGTWSGGTGSWTNANNPSTATYTAGASETGTITLTLTTSGGSCGTATATKTITINQNPTAPTSISGTTTVCSGQSTALTLQGGSAGTNGVAQWFEGSCGSAVIGTGNSITVSPTVNTTYFVRYAGSCNTTACASVSVNVNSASTAPTLSATGIICPNTTVDLVASGGTAGAGSQVAWYTGPNGTGSFLGFGNSFSFVPTASSIVYARREGTCNTTADASTSITIRDYVYAANNISSTNYCTDNSGWNHFYDGNNIILSVRGNLSSAGTVTALIRDNAAYFTDPGNAALCATGGNPGEAQFEMQRSWNVSYTGTLSGTYEVRYYFAPQERQDVIDAAAAFMAANPGCAYNYKYNPGNNGWFWFKNNNVAYTAPSFDDNPNFAIMSSTVPGTTPNGLTYTEISGITGFSGGTGAIILAPNAALPVELISFSANCNETGDKVNVNWSTASEYNSSHFFISRSTDGVNWENINTQNAAINSTTIQEYGFVDLDVRGYNKIYYKLTQVDMDGMQNVYNVVVANCHQNGVPTIITYPNPSSNDFTIDFGGSEMKGDVQLSIMNAEGKEISNREVNLEEGVNTYQINNMELQPGIYYLKIVDTTGRSFIIKHSFI